MKPKMITILVLVVLSLIIILQNTQPVPFKIFFWEPSVSKIVLIIISLLLGFVTGYIANQIGITNRKKK